MRKNNGGYVIIYVVFVIILLCIVAVGTCTVALNNLKTQTAYIEQMQDRYEAEGAIEKFMAEVCVECENLKSSSGGDRAAAITAAKGAVNAVIDETAGTEIVLSSINWEDDNSQCTVTATKSAGSSRAVVEIDFTMSITVVVHTLDENNDETSDPEKVKTTTYEYDVSNVTSKYLSYKLESTGGDSE